MKSVRLWDFIEYRSQPWQVVAQDGPKVALKNLNTNEVTKVAVTELLRDDTYLPKDPDTLPFLSDIRVLETLSPAQAEKAKALHRHVIEVLTGKGPEDDDPERPEYDPSLPLQDRIAAKSEELKRIGFRPWTERALYRYIARYRAEGMAGLVDKRSMQRPDVKGEADERLVAIVKDLMAQQADLSTVTRSRVITLANLEAKRLGVPVQSRTSMYRLISRLEDDKHPFGLATTRHTQGNKPTWTYTQRMPSRPGELVEIDSTPLDVLCRYRDGSVGRPDLTVSIDISTRTLCSAVLVPGDTKSIDAAIVLVKGLTPLAHQPGWGESVRLSRSSLPAGLIAPDEQVREASAARPVIVPEALTIDRGKVYTSSVFMEVARRLGISITKASPYSPAVKGHVETVFRVINQGFTQFLAGYTGSGVQMRGRKTDEQAALPIQAVQDALDYWIVAYYQQSPHSGLRHPAAPDRDITPNEAYAAQASLAPPVHVTLETSDVLALYPLTWRTVGPGGVTFKNLRYDSPLLEDMRGQKSGRTGAADGKWEVRYNPLNISVLWLYDHRDGTWIELPMTGNDMLVGPFSLDMANLAFAAAKERTSKPELYDVVGELNRMLTGDLRSTSERNALRRREVGVDALSELTALPGDADRWASEDTVPSGDKPSPSAMGTASGGTARNERPHRPFTPEEF